MTREHFIEGDRRNQDILDKEQHKKMMERAKKNGGAQIIKKGVKPTELVTFHGLDIPEDIEQKAKEVVEPEKQEIQDWAQDFRATVKLKQEEPKIAVEKARAELKRLFGDNE